MNAWTMCVVFTVTLELKKNTHEFKVYVIPCPMFG